MDDPTRMFRLDGRTAIVTGASSGLGVVMSEALAGAGANVVLAARRTERIEELARSITAAGGKALAVPCDVSREDDVDRMIAATQERFGSLDVLVNNAGVANPQPAEQESLEDFKRVLDVNLGGVFLCAQRCSRVMLAAGKGVIVNVASVLGVVGAGQIPQASYTASKGGVVNLTRELAAQWARRGIRVNAILPGLVPVRDDRRHVRQRRRQALDPRPHADGPRRRSQGAQRGAPLPRLRRFELRHRGDDPGRRRLDHRLVLRMRRRSAPESSAPKSVAVSTLLAHLSIIASSRWRWHCVSSSSQWQSSVTLPCRDRCSISRSVNFWPRFLMVGCARRTGSTRRRSRSCSGACTRAT